MATSPFTIRASNFHGIRHLDWSPAGLCLLVGPNGAGKTTALAVPQFMRTALLRGIPEAIRFAGGAAGLRNVRADGGADVVLELERADICWRIEIPVDGGGVHSYFGERLTSSGEVLLDVPRLQPDYLLGGQQRPHGSQAQLNTLLAVDPTPALRAFTEAVRNIRVYDDFHLNRAARPAPEDDEDHYLHPSGANVVPVLRNWKAAPRQFRGQFGWVIDHLRAAFPGLIEDLEFLPGGSAAFYPPGAPDPDAKIPLGLAAAGLLTGLLQLTAVAGAKPGSLIAFDEMENQLHPHAIRRILHAMRFRAEEQQLSILLTTHSPVVLNGFRDEPERVYVLGHGDPALPEPAPMSSLHSEEWLAQSKLGTLYERLAFAVPGPAR